MILIIANYIHRFLSIFVSVGTWLTFPHPHSLRWFTGGWTKMFQHVSRHDLTSNSYHQTCPKRGFQDHPGPTYAWLEATEECRSKHQCQGIVAKKGFVSNKLGFVLGISCVWRIPFGNQAWPTENPPYFSGGFHGKIIKHMVDFSLLRASKSHGVWVARMIWKIRMIFIHKT